MNSSANSKWWNVSKEGVAYYIQGFLAFIIVVVSIGGLANLTSIESALIDTALHYLLPNRRNESLLPDAAVEQLNGLLSLEHSGSVYYETEQPN